MELDAPPDQALSQSFTIDRPPGAALDDAARFLEGAGAVSSKLRGRLERFGDALAVHHGRIETRIRVRETANGCRVDVTRHGQGPLENTRMWLLGLGLGGFLLAWGVTFYNRQQGNLHPMVVVGLFLLGLVATVAVLFVADRSLERRSSRLILALEDAMRGKPDAVLDQEVAAFDRSTALANGFLFYCAALVATFFAYAIVFSDGVRAAIDVDAAVTTMRFVFLFPILPALAFAGIYHRIQHREHARRLRRFTGPGQ